MNPHERYQAFMRFEPVDRPPLQEWAPWPATVKQWMKQTGKDQDYVLRYLRQCDPEECTGIDIGMIPGYPETVLAQDEKTITRQDRMGKVYRAFKDDPETSMPEYLGSPVRTREEWKAVRERLNPDTPGRYPADWRERLARWKRDKPILRQYAASADYYGGPSLYGFVRMLVGDERAMYLFHDDPGWVHEMMEFSAEFFIRVLTRSLREAPLTLVQFWEDMCYRGGPLISPAMCREFMVPRYKRIAQSIRGAGIDILFVDSDGDVSRLLPLWIESGINGVFPMEQAAGNDIFAYRREYGKSLLMTGGIDKRALAKGPGAIDAELDRKVALAWEGGHIPTVDHSIPPDVSFENFQYYWRRKKSLLKC